MADGVERRAQVDTETVRGLQLMNGGMSAGLVTMLPSIMRDSSTAGLSLYMVAAIACGALGLVLAVIHNRLRRKCSLEYSRALGDRQRPFTNRLLRRCQSVPGEPAICTKSVMYMWASLICFVLGATVIGVGFASESSELPVSSDACWRLESIDGHAAKFNACTGELQAITW